jgi:hypothetical protein
MGAANRTLNIGAAIPAVHSTDRNAPGRSFARWMVSGLNAGAHKPHAGGRFTLTSVPYSDENARHAGRPCKTFNALNAGPAAGSRMTAYDGGVEWSDATRELSRRSVESAASAPDKRRVSGE